MQIDRDLDELAALVAPPRQAPGAQAAEPNAVPGFELPADYIRLLKRYGGGYFDEYLYVLEPGCANSHYDLLDAIPEREEALRGLWQAGERRPPELEESGSRLIPWASTDNGEFAYWLMRPGRGPRQWTVMLNEARGDRWEHYPVGCLRFLVDVLSRRVRSEVLSSRFPKAEHSFRTTASFVG